MFNKKNIPWIKKYIYLSFWFFILFVNKIFAKAPTIPSDLELPWSDFSEGEIVEMIWWGFITSFIKFLAIIAVIALMASWLLYLLSGWEEEKVKKAKNWVIWSLVWVILSISAWWIINVINSLQINN